MTYTGFYLRHRYARRNSGSRTFQRNDVCRFLSVAQVHEREFRLKDLPSARASLQTTRIGKGGLMKDQNRRGRLTNSQDMYAE